MSRQAKLLKRLQSRPNDLTWAELVTIMASFGFDLHLSGGSSRKFIHSATRVTLMMHEPRPGSILKVYQVQAAIELLKNEGYLQ